MVDSGGPASLDFYVKREGDKGRLNGGGVRVSGFLDLSLMCPAPHRCERSEVNSG